MYGTIIHPFFFQAKHLGVTLNSSSLNLISPIHTIIKSYLFYFPGIS